MARQKSPTLTDAELRLMRVLWKLERGTVADIKEGLHDDEPLAYSTVLTTMRILEDKGLVRHEKEGRAFVYEPLVESVEAKQSALKHLMGRFFDDSPEMLVANLIEVGDVSEESLSAIRALLEQANTGGK